MKRTNKFIKIAENAPSPTKSVITPKVDAYIGIDPGSASGGFALIFQHICYTVRFKDLTEKDLITKLREVRDVYCPAAVVEKISLRPAPGGKQRKGATAFVRNYGIILGALMALDIPFREVTPRVWQKTFAMSKKKNETNPQWKKRLRQRAQELYPDANIVTETGDAVLIAEYCRKNW